MYGIVLAAALTTGAGAPDCYVGAYCGWYGYCGYGYCAPVWPSYYCWGYPVYYYPTYYYPAYYYPAYPYPAGVVVASTQSSAPTETARAEPATVVIRAATDVTVMVNGRAIARSSSEEVFLTPDLTPGKSYVYRISTSRDGEPIGKSRQVTVRAGQRTEVDFKGRSAEPRSAVARVSVHGPGAARLIVNEKDMGTLAARRSFETPPLQPGRRYFYTVKVELADGTRTRTATRRIAVEADRDVTVDFSDLVSTARAER